MSYREEAEKLGVQLDRVQAERDQLVQLVDMLLEGVELNKRLFTALRDVATTEKERAFLQRSVNANIHLHAAGRLGKSAAVGGAQV